MMVKFREGRGKPLDRPYTGCGERWGPVREGKADNIPSFLLKQDSKI
jgi:hypothetical protein